MGLAGVYHPAAQRSQSQVERTWLSLERRQEMLAALVWGPPAPLQPRPPRRISRDARNGNGVAGNTRKGRRDDLEGIQGDRLAGMPAAGIHANVRHSGQSRRVLETECGDLPLFQSRMRVLCSFTAKHP